MKTITDEKHKKIDWIITLVPLGMVIGLCILFFVFPEKSNMILSQIRFFLGIRLEHIILLLDLGYLFYRYFLQPQSMEILS